MLVRLFYVGLIILACSHSTHAETIVARDTIGDCGVDGTTCTSTRTDGMPGASMRIESIGASNLVAAPGSRFVANNNGILDEAKFVVFAFDNNSPVNDIAFFDNFHLTFNLWNDGIANGLDSFANNPIGDAINGHVRHIVHNPVGGHSNSTISEFGHTGPAGNEFLFTTFLISVDLTEYDIPIENEREYVFNVVLDLAFAPSNAISPRLLGSTDENGTEDVWFDSALPTSTPGFVQTQHNAGFDLFGTYLSINTDSADFDTDNDIDGADFLAWQRGFGTLGGATKAQGDANDDGNVNAEDLAVWENQYGDVTSPLLASATVPEPSTAVLLSMSVTFLFVRRRPQC